MNNNNPNNNNNNNNNNIWEPTPLGPPSTLQVVDHVPLMMSMSPAMMDTMLSISIENSVSGITNDFDCWYHAMSSSSSSNSTNDTTSVNNLTASSPISSNSYNDVGLEHHHQEVMAATAVPASAPAAGFVTATPASHYQYQQSSSSWQQSASSSLFPIAAVDRSQEQVMIPLVPMNVSVRNLLRADDRHQLYREKNNSLAAAEQQEHQTTVTMTNFPSSSTPGVAPAVASLSTAAAAAARTTTRRKGKSSSSSSSCKPKQSQTQQWNRKYEELCNYKIRFGTCHVPYDSKDEYLKQLAQWTKRQRYQYKLKCDCKYSTLTDERKQALDSIGFIWQRNNFIWEEKFQELKSFQQLHGHCNIWNVLLPSTTTTTTTNNDSDDDTTTNGTSTSRVVVSPQLKVWVHCQRRQLRQYRRSGSGYGGRSYGGRGGGRREDDHQQQERSYIIEERIQKLDSIGFDWKPPRGKPRSSSSSSTTTRHEQQQEGEQHQGSSSLLLSSSKSFHHDHHYHQRPDS